MWGDRSGWASHGWGCNPDKGIGWSVMERSVVWLELWSGSAPFRSPPFVGTENIALPHIHLSPPRSTQEMCQWFYSLAPYFFILCKAQHKESRLLSGVDKVTGSLVYILFPLSVSHTLTIFWVIRSAEESISSIYTSGFYQLYPGCRELRSQFWGSLPIVLKRRQ